MTTIIASTSFPVRKIYINENIVVAIGWYENATGVDWIQSYVLCAYEKRRLKTKSNFSYQLIATTVQQISKN